MQCSACLAAMQVADYRHYVKACVGCQIRKLAHMPAEKRERQLDLLCHLCGPGARERVRQEMRVELARIRKLRAAGPRQRA